MGRFDCICITLLFTVIRMPPCHIEHQVASGLDFILHTLRILPQTIIGLIAQYRNGSNGPVLHTHLVNPVLPLMFIIRLSTMCSSNYG